MRSISFRWLFVAGVLFCSTAHAESLRSPWDATAITPTDTPYNCPAPPAFAKTLEIEGYYTDKQYSVIDPKKLAAFNAASAGPTHLGQYSTSAADAWLSKGSRAAAACVYSLLDAAAKADAWDDKMPQATGVQGWMLSGTAIAYLKVRNSHMGTPDQDADILKWFRLVAARVREYFDVQRTKPGSDAWNNHMYWAGLAVTAEGIACNDVNAFFWGIETYRMGVDAIQPDGSLTAEMNRAGMAEHYQLYALGPLVMLAELGAANGLDLYPLNDGAIHRLVKFSVAGRLDPSIIEKRTGVPQNLPDLIGGLEIGWAVPYVQRFPDTRLSDLIAKGWVNFWQWGGAPPNAVIPVPPRSGALPGLSGRSFTGTHSFIGTWCGQGDRMDAATITDSGAFLTLKASEINASIGVYRDMNTIFAPGWQFITGTLSPDGKRIDWSNDTYWTRCKIPEARAHSRLKLAGTWYADGMRAEVCSIRQHDNTLQLDKGRGAIASGSVDEQGRLTTDWSGNSIVGTVSSDGNRIEWDNGTWWVRANIYESRK
jgi:poly(beta-D-mannuronate) lyase